MRLFEFQRKIRAYNLKIFTTTEFQRFMDLKRKAAQELLSRYTKKSIVIKLRNNYYTTEFNYPSTYLLSNKIYQPSYLSFETALSYYGIIPETVYEITAATTKTTREFNVQDRIFRYHKIKKTAYTGYYPSNIDNDTIRIAYPEKALIDYLYFVYLGKKSLNDRINLKKINKKKILKYLSLYNKKFTEFVKNVIKR